MSESVQSTSTSESPSLPSDFTGSSSASSNATRSFASDDRQAHDDSSHTSPVDMECTIQADRITKILDKLVYQTKLAICLPSLMRDNILAEILTDEHFDDVQYIIRQHQFPLASQSFMNICAMEDMLAGDMSLRNRVNPDLAFLMTTLFSYPELRPHVEGLIEKIKTDLEFCCEKPTSLRIYGKGTTSGLKHLLKLEEFRDLTVIRLQTTAAEELSAIIRTRKLEKSNNKCLDRIQDDSKCLKEEKLNHDKKIREKLQLIGHLKQELAINEQKVAANRKKQILDSERQMVLATRAHKVKYQMLKEEEIESKELYNNSVSHNMLAEKHLRDRRRKVETQLQSWLQKYDAEMQVKQEELDDITKQYGDEFQKIEELKIKLVKQNKEFFPLMAEREEEYHQEMTAKMETFIIEHAARVIQIAWRDTCKNRDEKKKLLKLKRKMEAEREAAAKKAEAEAKKQALLERKMAAKARAEAKAAAKAAKLEAKAAKAGNQAGQKEAAEKKAER